MGLGDQDPVLEFAVKCLLPAGTSAHQTDDGTIFYYKYQRPQRLYVKREEVEIDVQLPNGSTIADINAKIIHANAIYFLENGKIYRAEFNNTDALTASFVRDRLEGETITYGGMCSRVRKGKKFAYRLCDEPEKDGIIIDVPRERLENENLELRGIHRKKAIYLNTRAGREPSAQGIFDNVIALQCLLSSTPFMRDSSRYIYITNQHCVFVLDIVYGLFMPLLSCGDTPIRSIVSVIEDVITVRSRKDGVECLMTAKLPERYFDEKNSSTEFRF